MAGLTPLQFATDDDCWDALVTRNPCADACFRYGVKTTGVFCRPTCPSRKPNRENVLFFATSHVAITAGYRPCQRCNPLESSIHQRYRVVVQQACELIEGAEEPPTLEHLAEHVGLSRFYLQRLFKKYVGITPKEYATACQIARLKQSLAQGAPILQAIYDAGFSSTSRVYEKTVRELGMTPAQFKNGAAGMRIRYVLTSSPLGTQLLAMTEQGICEIDFDASPHELVERLSQRFPNAFIFHGGAELTRKVEHILGIIAAPQFGLKLPPHILSIALQRRLWKALHGIAPGT
ncbi:AraC family transcriptional regulator [Cystobacter fuscus]|uniref:AraC family transcriptional regulator n=1 Tax=Cystobacter fuscus TaxID=43 RepID=A0A250JHL9_9BACT|nr:Ada metal-binding domain-containing protein [Cystobacter fuscus]ATB42901.1 AraC family transcriptional regulator [Cystobacter fuscus]